MRHRTSNPKFMGSIPIAGMCMHWSSCRFTVSLQHMAPLSKKWHLVQIFQVYDDVKCILRVPVRLGCVETGFVTSVQLPGYRLESSRTMSVGKKKVIFAWSQLFSILGLIVGIMADPAIVSFVGAKCQLCGLGQYLVSLFGIYFYHPLESWAPVSRFVANPSAGGYIYTSFSLTCVESCGVWVAKSVQDIDGYWELLLHVCVC